ncbi:MAG: recombinase family protein [Bacteroidaceae bacterium]|nr:recombinase family protein [Bacteroidaceae bacterium]
MTVFEKQHIVSEALKMDVYAIYLRKSRSDDPEESVEETVERHKKILTDLAARKGFFIGEIYQEVVSGAESIEGRPEIKRLIQDCYDGKYRGILVVEITRLSRGSSGDAQVIMDCLTYGNRNNGVLVVTPTKVYDVAHNSDDAEYMEFELFMSRREYKMINKRMNRGKLQCVVEGEYMGSYRPYGWEIVEEGKRRTLKPHETEYEIGKMIYAWKIEGLTPYSIAKRLTNMGVPTYTGRSKEWSKETIKEFLRNPVNMGKVRWNDRMQVKVMADGELKTTRPRSNHTDHYMLYEGLHKDKAMVTEEEFNLATKDFRPDRTKANLKLSNVLAGLLTCKKCGKVMHYQGMKHRPGTTPRFVHPAVQLCKVKSVTEEDVLKAVAHSLEMYIEDFEMKLEGMPSVNENAVSLQIEVLQKEQRKVKRKLDKLFDDYEDEVYTANEFVERKAIHNERLAAIQQQIASLENTIPEKEDFESKVIRLTEALVALEDKNLEADIKNAYLKDIIDKIEFSRENNEEFILDVFIK